MRRISTTLAIVGLNLSVMTLLLTTIPATGDGIGIETDVIGLLVGLHIAMGMIVDVAAGQWVNRFGFFRLLAAGVLIGCLASVPAIVGIGLRSLLILSVGTGIATALIGNPALALLAQITGPRNSAKVQGINGGVQRLGALLSSLAIARFLDVGNGRPLLIIVLILFAAIGIAILLVEEYPTMGHSHTKLGRSFIKAYELLVRSKDVKSAGIINAWLTLSFVTGASFYSLHLLGTGASGLVVGIALGLREVVSIAASPFYGLLASRWNQQFVWGCSAIGGSVFLGLAALTASTELSIALFLCHGIAISFGVAATNLHAIASTEPENLVYALAGAGLIGRISGVVFPVSLGALVAGFSTSVAILTAGLAGCVMVCIYLAINARQRENTAIRGRL